MLRADYGGGRVVILERSEPPADFMRRRLCRQVEGVVERLRYTVEVPGHARKDVLDAEALLAELDGIFREVRGGQS
jgi:hypothetical protein